MHQQSWVYSSPCRVWLDYKSIRILIIWSQRMKISNWHFRGSVPPAGASPLTPEEEPATLQKHEWTSLVSPVTQRAEMCVNQADCQTFVTGEDMGSRPRWTNLRTGVKNSDSDKIQALSNFAIIMDWLLIMYLFSAGRGDESRTFRVPRRRRANRHGSFLSPPEAPGWGAATHHTDNRFRLVLVGRK